MGSRSTTVDSAHSGDSSELSIAAKKIRNPKIERLVSSKPLPTWPTQCSASKRYSTKSRRVAAVSAPHSPVWLSIEE